jgi:hypothetical protein
MVFMQIAVSAIGIGIVVMVGYLVIAQVRSSLPLTSLDDTTAAAVNSSLTNTQTTVFAGFSLVAVGIIVLAAFGMISIFQ